MLTQETSPGPAFAKAHFLYMIKGMSLYRSMDYRTIISQLVAERKKADPKFGHAALAREISVQKTYVSRVLSGDRDFSTDQIHAIARFFQLDETAQNYLLLLLEHARTGLAWRKRELHRQITQIQVQQRHIKKTLSAEMLDPASSPLTAYYLDPWNAIVHHFFALPGYQKNPARIAKVLGLAKPQFDRILSTLESSGVLKRNAKTQLFEVAKEHMHLERESALTLPHLVATRQLSLQQIQRVPRDEKITFSVTMATNERTRVLIHECFLKFLKEIEPAVRDSAAEEIYQINFDLFPWASLVADEK